MVFVAQSRFGCEGQMFRAEYETKRRKEEPAVWLPGFEPPPKLRPILRWSGGKSRLLAKILPHVPKNFGRYHEPFLGGGAIFFAIGHRATKGCRLADLNRRPPFS